MGKTHTNQKAFLDNLFSQLGLLLEEAKTKYSTRVEKTFQSIRDIYTEKGAKLAKFEREMKELEKDVRLNYSNIIRLMDLEPFYEIIYRYNKKLNNIKVVFTEFKGKPDEIPEAAVIVKNMSSRLAFVTGIGKRLEHFFDDSDCFDSNNVSQDNVEVPPVIEIQLLEKFNILGKAVSHSNVRMSPFASLLDKACQTDSLETEMFKKKNQTLANTNKDDLKVQAELLIKSVDHLMSKEEFQPIEQSKTLPSRFGLSSPTTLGGMPSPSSVNSVGMKQSSRPPEFRQSKSITKAEIARRIQVHFNTANPIGKARSSSHTHSQASGGTTKGVTSPIPLEKVPSEGVLCRDIDPSQLKETINKQRGIERAKMPASKDKSLPISPPGINLPPPPHLPGKQRLSKQSPQQQSAGVIREPQGTIIGTKPTLTTSKTDRLLQLYRKNKQSQDG